MCVRVVQSYWIWGAHPFDYDNVPVTIKGHSAGVGHYVGYFYWKGYSGCIDYERACARVMCTV